MRTSNQRLVVMLAALLATAASACTQEEAIEMMRAVGQAQTEFLMGGPADQQRAAAMAREVGSVGALLAQSRFDEACATYSGIATKFGFDLAEYRAKLAPIQNDIPGECDVLEATKRVNGSHRIFQESVDMGELSPIEQHKKRQAFTQSIGRANVYVQTDPERACTIVAETLERFGAR